MTTLTRKRIVHERIDDAVPRRAHGSNGDVELVTRDGLGLGHISVVEAHTYPGALHRAFSIVLTDGHGRICLQRRASSKQRWPGNVANACCGHPRSRDLLLSDAATRLNEELGISPPTLREVGHFVYWARELDGEMVEWEYDHVFVGVCQDRDVLRPDPREVAEVLWWAPGQQIAGPLAPWLGPVLNIAISFLNSV